MAKVTNILAGDGFRGDLSSIVSTTTKEEKRRLRNKFYKDLIDNAVAVPVGIAEGAVGLPGDIEGLARGAYRAYNAEDGDRLEAFGSAFADTTLPSTQQIQDFTNEHLLDNEFGEMVRRGKYGRLAGELVAPASVVTAPTKTLAKGAGALSDNQFFQKLANPLDVDVQPSIFIGPKAKTYPHDVAKKVEKLEKEGKSPKDIWNTIYKEHGELPYRTKDDVLWFERDDSLLKTSPVKASRNKAYKLDEVVQAQDNPYFAEYPVMRQDTASVKPNRVQGKSSYSPRRGYDELGDKPRYEFGIINEYGGPDAMDAYRQIKNDADLFNKSARGQSYSKEVDELDTVLKELNRDSKKLKKSSNYEADRVALNKRIDDYNIKRDKIYEKYPEVLDYKENMEFWANRVNPKTLSRLRPDDVQISLENFRHEGQHGIQHIEGAGHGGSSRDPEYKFLLGEQMSNANAGRGNLSMAERANRFIGEPDGTLQTFTKPDAEHVVRKRTPRFDEKDTPEHLKQLFKDKFGKEDSFFDTIDNVYDPLREIDPGAIKSAPRKYSDAQNYYDYLNPDKVPEAVTHMGYFEPHYGIPKDNPLDFLHSKANRGDIMGSRVPKDAPIQPAKNTFYDDIRVNEPFPEPTREVFEFTKGTGDSKGGPVSMVKDINVPYKTTRQVLPESDNIYKGAVQGRPTQPNSWTSNAVGSRKPYKDKVIYKQDKTKGISTTGITPERAERLRRGEIKLPEPRNNTADIAWTRSTERPYDTTQFIRDTKVKDGNLFARLARDDSREYGSMFDNVVSSDKGGYEWFDRTAVDKYMTPHTGKFVQEIKSSPNGNYNKLKLGKSSGKSTQDLQKQVDRAVDIANDNIGHPTPEDKLDAFIKAMDKIEDVNARYVSRGKPTKVKEDAMNYLWQIHDDLQKEAVKYRNTLLPQRTDKGGIMFNDNPTVTDVGTGEVDMDKFLENLARGE